MKRILCAVMALLMMVAMTGCGEYHQGVAGTRPSQQRPSGPVDVNSTEAYTVTLMKDGQPYSPEIEIYAQWTDGYSYYTAKFDENGVAAITGLDGDYTVTLSAVPMDYTYNTNGYKVTSDNRQITIEIYRIYLGEGEGNGLYYPEVKEMSHYGVYEITIDGPDDVVYCRFLPSEKGIYNIESWADVSEDNINPKMDRYHGTVAFVWYEETIDEGGAQSATGFCKNFKYTYTIVEEEVGNSFTFAVRATAKDGKYPITVQVAVERIGDPPEKYFREMVVPQEVIRYAPNFNYTDDKGIVHSSEFIWAENGGTMFDQRMYKLWKVEDGGDGYYHLYDAEKYASTNGYGPTLYAKVSSSSRYEVGLNQVEYQGTGNSWLTQKTDASHFKNYKHFIEGFRALAEVRVTDPQSGAIGSSYCIGTCPCHPNNDIGNYTGCQEGCTKCDERCTQVRPELYGAPGYANGANSDGCYPVTQELKELLQMFAINRTYFVDGTGVIETHETYPMDSDEESQWLFCCGYYAEDEGGLCQMGDKVPNHFD